MFSKLRVFIRPYQGRNFQKVKQKLVNFQISLIRLLCFQVLESAGFVNVQALDRTDLFVASLQREVNYTKSIKDQYIEVKTRLFIFFSRLSVLISEADLQSAWTFPPKEQICVHSMDCCGRQQSLLVMILLPSRKYLYLLLESFRVPIDNYKLATVDRDWIS